MKKVVLSAIVIILSINLNAQSILDHSGFIGIYGFRIITDDTVTANFNHNDDVILRDSINSLLKSIPESGNVWKDIMLPKEKTKLIYWNPYGRVDSVTFYGNILMPPTNKNGGTYALGLYNDTKRLYELIQVALKGDRFTLHNRYYNRALSLLMQQSTNSIRINDTLSVALTNKYFSVRNGIDIITNGDVYTIYPYKHYDTYCGVVKSNLESNYSITFYKQPQFHKPETIAFLNSVLDTVIKQYWNPNLLFDKSRIYTKIGEGIARDYTNFVLEATTYKTDVTRLKKHILTDAVSITTGRTPNNKGYGNDLNLPFMKEKFNPKVISLKYLDNNFNTLILRTNTSTLWFVNETRKWKLYKITHKPSN